MFVNDGKIEVTGGLLAVGAPTGVCALMHAIDKAMQEITIARMDRIILFNQFIDR